MSEVPDFTNRTTEPSDDGEPTAARNWPTLHPNALQGACGEIVGMIMPHTEADPAAVIATLLSGFGAMAGTGAFALAGNDPHPARIWPLITGRTSDGAKGTSWSTVRPILQAADNQFLVDNLQSGIVSGEGVIEMVRDEVEGDGPDSKSYVSGVSDKRLLIIEPEYAAVLSKGARQGSSLMQILREAWDGNTLRSMARSSNKLVATNPHITVVGHVTPGEFHAKLTKGEIDGGSINRLLIVLSRRSKELPDGGNLPGDVTEKCGKLVSEAVEAAKGVGRITRTEAADALWHVEYSKLVAPKPDGYFATATARAQAQVLRLSVAYALLDCSEVVDVAHLRAALALWAYAEESARVLFADLGYEDRKRESDALTAFIGTGGTSGVTRNEIREKHFQRNKTAVEIDAVLAPLISEGRVDQVVDRSGPGRPKTTYRLRGKRGNAVSASTSVNGEDLPGRSKRGNAVSPDAEGELPRNRVTATRKVETDKTRSGDIPRNRVNRVEVPACPECRCPLDGAAAGRTVHLDCERRASQHHNDLTLGGDAA